MGGRGSLAARSPAPEVGGTQQDPQSSGSTIVPLPPSRVAAEAGPGFVARSRWRRRNPAGSASAR